MLTVIDYMSQSRFGSLQVNLDTVLNWIETSERLKIKKYDVCWAMVYSKLCTEHVIKFNGLTHACTAVWLVSLIGLMVCESTIFLNTGILGTDHSTFLWRMALMNGSGPQTVTLVPTTAASDPTSLSTIILRWLAGSITHKHTDIHNSWHRITQHL